MHHQSHIADVVCGVAALLLVAAIVKAGSRRVRLPYTIALVAVGMLISALSEHVPALEHLARNIIISPDLVLYVFLPTLVFESAYNLDARQLRRSLGTVLTLAVPGFLVSTLIIGLIVGLASPVPLLAALLLGAILSATDPVAVIALFKELGAPKRLTVLVEGESLFNDATAMVVSAVLLTIIRSGVITAHGIADGVLDFFVLFLGGIAVGWLLGLFTGWLLGKILAAPFEEITLTTVLAYLSFILAENVFHVSGIMATLAAGITLGDWGRMKISPTVREYLDSFWEYMAGVANALIFLLLGLRLDISAGETPLLLALVLFAMLVSRAIVIYGMLPLVGRLRGEEPVDMNYRTIMFWGGLRGAIAIAIVLSLDSTVLPHARLFTSLVMAVVIFTLLAQGLTIRPLIHHLGIDRPTLYDRLARLEVSLEAQHQTQKRISELLQSGLFSGPIAARLQADSMLATDKLSNDIANLREAEMHARQELCQLYLRCFAEEKSFYQEMFSHGHLSERAMRELVAIVDLQLDRVRHQDHVTPVRISELAGIRLQEAVCAILDRVVFLAPIAEKLRQARVSRNYEEAWGHHQASRHVLKYIDRISSLEAIPAGVLRQVTEQFQHWHENARRQMDLVAEQFPEFFIAMQERLGRRLALIAEREAAMKSADNGVLPHGLAEKIQAEVAASLSDLKGQEVAKLRIQPEELLGTVPFFRDIPAGEFETISRRMRLHTVAAGDVVIHQGEPGDSLFLIARGVMRVCRMDGNRERELATLVAGDFFGEMALLKVAPRSATVRAITPGSLYELNRKAMLGTMRKYPGIRQALEAARQRREKEMQ